MDKAKQILNDVGRLNGLPELNETAIPEILRRWAQDVEVLCTLISVTKKEYMHDGQGCHPAAALPGS